MKILSEDGRLLSLACRDKVTGCFYDDNRCLPQILEDSRTARSPAVDNDFYLLSVGPLRRPLFIGRIVTGLIRCFAVVQHIVPGDDLLAG